MRYELSDFEWAAIKPMLPNKPRGVPRANDRRVLNGIFWVLRSGALWRDLPEKHGPYTTCLPLHSYSCRCCISAINGKGNGSARCRPADRGPPTSSAASSASNGGRDYGANKSSIAATQDAPGLIEIKTRLTHFAHNRPARGIA